MLWFTSRNYNDRVGSRGLGNFIGKKTWPLMMIRLKMVKKKILNYIKKKKKQKDYILSKEWLTGKHMSKINKFLDSDFSVNGIQ